MASEARFRVLQEDTEAAGTFQDSLLSQCLQRKDGTPGRVEPVPGMKFRLERLLRHVYRRDSYWFYNISHNTDSFELAVAISFKDNLINKDGVSVPPVELFMNLISGPAPTLKLPPRCWFHLVRRAASRNPFDTMDPDKDDHINMFPLHLASAILHSFFTSPNGLIHDFNSPLVLDFNDVLPYFRDEIYDNVLDMFSQFVQHPSLSEPSLPQSLKVMVAAINFFLHRLSLAESGVSHPTICQSLTTAVQSIRRQTFTSQEATAVIIVLEDTIAPCVIPPLNIESDWSDLCHETILAYQSLTTIAPSAYSSHGLQSMVDFMKSHWDQTEVFYYTSNAACRVLTDLLAKRIAVAFTVFHESQCLQFLGIHTFHKASVPMVSAYITGIFAMQRGSDGAVDEAMLRLHIDHLHNPHNLFTACSILATHGVSRIDRTAIRRDITILAQLRPRDASWDECRRKLDDLVHSDDGDSFSEQRLWPEFDDELRPLHPDRVQAEKENIRYAIHVLDDLFGGGGHTGMDGTQQVVYTGF
ncbi:hypothetical protein ARMGADRAFT_1089691 [Armillaria gallica]|uniref:Uncharacterized protein n=1 Tax=Armillaria gallica TaxID=47427 RepID=A0A2H3D6M3_ARMGA|nr:hypothetical protein ARMGADRAFT_1089691 [Armillaria gallica]